MLKRAKHQIVIIEGDYLNNEVVLIPHDVYSLTIAANLTHSCSPSNYIICFRQCIIVFIIQILFAFLFCWEETEFEKV